MTSNGMKTILSHLSKRVLKVTGNKKYRYPKMVFNWGKSEAPEKYQNVPKSKWINCPYNVSLAVDKLKTFNILSNYGVSIPAYTTSLEIAEKWLRQGHTVLQRNYLNSSQGKGIRVVHPGDVLHPAPLFVRYKKKKDEYRIHVFKGNVIQVALKKRRLGIENVSNEIRNYENGWIFCIQNINPPNSVKTESIKAVKALGLDFGAVDVIYNEYEDKAYVLEINTAPGVEGTTAVKYAKELEKFA